MPIAKHAGAIAKIADGRIAKAPAAPTTPTNTCTDGGNPVGAVKVTMNFAGGGTVNWLGEEWSDGTTHYICPGLYGCTNPGATPDCTNAYFAQEYWGQGGAVDLLYLRGLNNGGDFVGYLANRGWNSVRIKGVTFGKGTGGGTWYLKITGQARINCLGGSGTYKNTGASTGLSTFPSATGIVPTAPADATPISNALFGQLTTTGGVTITWERAFPEDWNTCGL
jgi:hypothetical protein